MDFSFLNIFKDHYQNIISILIIGILGFVSWKVFSILIRKKLENTQQIKDEAQGQRINTLRCRPCNWFWSTNFSKRYYNRIICCT